MSIVSNKNFDLSNEAEGKLPAMPKATETLAAFISRIRRDKNLTLQQVADSSGGRISPNYVYNLEKGFPTDNLGAKKIVGLGRGLDESPILIFRLVAGLAETKDELLSEMIGEYSVLSKSDQDDLKLMIELLRKEIYARRKRSTAS